MRKQGIGVRVSETLFQEPTGAPMGQAQWRSVKRTVTSSGTAGVGKVKGSKSLALSTMSPDETATDEWGSHRKARVRPRGFLKHRFWRGMW